EPHNIGTSSTFSAAQWFGSGGPWDGAVVYSGTWMNKYVAVVEPPLEKGRIQVKQVKRTGSKMISPREATEQARRAIAQLNLPEGRHSFFTQPNVVPAEPMLVQEGSTQSNLKNAPAYYIVPFGFRQERAERGPLTRGCVLVNAFTGAFEEVTTFGKPVRYLPEEEAIAIVAAALKANDSSLRRPEVKLMFQPGDITHVRTFPFWRVRFGRRTVYIDQMGKLYVKFLPSIPGD